jgi:hypothetical protein
LHKVSDAAADAGSSTYGQYNDIRQGQNDNNYAYDAIGNLIKDEAEGISNINWNVYGKISSISKSTGTIRYSYDAQGNRVIKQSGRDTTAYVRDASGNVLAVYTHRSDVGVVQVERHLYGSSRLGVAGYSAARDTITVLSGGFGNAIKSTFTRGQKLFELTNYLGNVLATVSDKRLQVDKNADGNVDDYAPDVVTASDYYPFGMLMPGRSGHQGQGGSGWINGGGASSPDQGLPESLQLDDPRSGNTPAAYAATDHIDIIPDFESQAGDDFIVYVDNTNSSGGSGGSGGSGSSGGGDASNGYYRYGFNGQERSTELNNDSYTAEFWQYGARLARRWNLDPKPDFSVSPYAALGNNPIWYSDPLGDTTINGQKYEPKDMAHATTLEQVIVTAKVPKKPMTADYSKRFFAQMNRMPVRMMLTGLSTVGNRLFGSPYDPYRVLRLNEAEKQKIFDEDANKTLGILFSEFVEGTGLQRRDFNTNTPITQEIANSYTTSLFFDYFYPLYKSGAFNDGVERMHTIFTSPDNAESMKKSIKAHGQIISNLSAFFTGSLDYYFKISGNKLYLRVHNEFSISSGVSRNKQDDLHRVPLHDSPLGNTEQYFNFSVDLDKLKKQ